MKGHNFRKFIPSNIFSTMHIYTFILTTFHSQNMESQFSGNMNIYICTYFVLNTYRVLWNSVKQFQKSCADHNKLYITLFLKMELRWQTVHYTIQCIATGLIDLLTDWRVKTMRRVYLNSFFLFLFVHIFHMFTFNCCSDFIKLVRLRRTQKVKEKMHHFKVKDDVESIKVMSTELIPFCTCVVFWHRQVMLYEKD